ncbi:outer membrane beta-barrel protein [bacterium]|nr:outer membrane beta-barrel protein [bacterium]
MKLDKVVILILTLIFTFSSAYAGKLKLGGKVSTYNPPGDAGSTVMFEGTATYLLSDYLSIQGSLGWTTYKSGGETVTLMPVTVDGIFHFLGRQKLDPYAGAGIGYYRTTVGGADESTFGFQLFSGIEWRPSSNFGLSFEVKYRVPDISQPDQGGVSFGGGITGDIELDI